MRFHILKLLFVLTTFVSCNESTKEINSIIENKKTAKHFNVPNTQLFIIPPKGFTYSKDLSGFENGNLAMIQIFNETKKAEINTDRFNESKFNNKNAETVEFEEFTLNGYQAKYNHLRRGNGVEEYNLLFGDSTFSVIIMAISPNTKPEIGEGIKKAMLSVTYDKNIIVASYQLANFTLTDTNNRFKFVKPLASLFYYSIDGKDNSNEPNEPRLVISNIPHIEDQTAKDITNQTLFELERNGLQNIKTSSETGNRLNGYDAHYVQIESVWNNSPITMLFQAVVFERKAILIQCSYPEKLSVNAEDFHELCSKIKMK